jgi:hypothetical protein
MCVVFPRLVGSSRCLAVVISLIALAPAAVAQTTAATWSSAVSGNWNDPTMWSSSPFFPNNGNPVGTSYTATVDATGAAYTVTLGTDVTVNSLTLNSSDATIQQTAGTFTGTINTQFGALNLTGGTIANSQINSSPSLPNSPARTTVLGPTTFDNVTINGSVFVDGEATLTVRNGITLGQSDHGLWFQNTGGSIDFSGDQTIGGTGAVVFGQATHSTGVVRAVNGGTLTIGSGVTVRTTLGGSEFNTLGDPNSGLIINGTVQSASSLTSIDITGKNWVNNGVITESNGGTINLSGTFTTAGLGDFRSPEGRVQIQGTLDNTGATLTMDDTHGSLVLQGGTVVGGTISSSTAHPFYANPASAPAGTLNGVTLAGVMDMSIGKLQVLNGLTLNSGQIIMDAGSFGKTSNFAFPGTQTLAGTGEVVFAGTTAIVQPEGGTLTLAPGITVRTGGAAGTLGNATDGLINQGTVSAQTANRTLSVLGGVVTNTGTMEAQNLATLAINTSTSFTNQGLLVAQSGGAINFTNAFTQDVSAAAETRVLGTLTATGVTLNTGSLTGTGTVSGPVTNQSGTVSPGVSGAGVLTVGAYTQGAGGKLSLDIGGATRGTQYDALSATSINLSGTVQVHLIGGFAPAAGQKFDVLDWTGTSTGTPTFDFSDAALASGLAWDTSQFGTDGTIQVVPVPEPGVLAALAGWGGLLAWHRFRRAIP